MFAQTLDGRFVGGTQLRDFSRERLRQAGVCLRRLRFGQFIFGSLEVLRQFVGAHFEHGLHLDHALHLVLNGLAPRFHRAGGVLHFATHAGEVALHMLDATLGVLQLAFQIFHHFDVKFFGHFQRGDGGAQTVFTVFGPFAGFFCDQAALFILQA